MHFRLSRLDLGIFLISFAILFLELMLTRIFSVTLHYHLSFMAVSIAMLGLGASGLIVNGWPGRFPRERMLDQIALGARRFAVAAVFVVGAAFYLSVPVDSAGTDWIRLAVIFVLCALPFLAGGWVIALIFTHNPEKANRLYCFDLLGAAGACLVFIPATNILGAPTAVLAGAATAAITSVVFAGSSREKSRPGLILTAFLIAATAANAQWNFYDIRVAKGRNQAVTLAQRWNSFSRVEVEGTAQDLITPRRPGSDGFSARLDPAFRTREVYLRYDADALTQITGFDGNNEELAHLPFDVASAPYHARRYHNVLVIGAGGGRDVLTALYMGSQRITGVEVNPITIDLMKHDLRDFNGGIYTDYPNIKIVNDEARSFLQRSPEKYDLIQASLIDTWASSAAGAHALTENSLYTVEAFHDYLNHLTPDGIVSFSRWYLDTPVESLRVVHLAIEALRQKGIQDARAHVFVVRTNPQETNRPSLCTILIKQSAFSHDELASLGRWSNSMGFLMVYSPDDEVSQPNEFDHLVSPQRGEFVAKFPYDISAVYDERPFFFNRVPLLSWIFHRIGIGNAASGQGELTVGGQTLFLLLLLTAFSTLGLVSFPLWAHRRSKKDTSPTLPFIPKGRFLLWALYFACLGLGFIIVEIVLIQRFSLFLGYPVYSLSVVLFTVLLASGIGSMLASRWNGSRLLPRVFAGILVLIGLYVVLLPWVTHLTLGSPTTMRIFVAAAVVAPLALLMGMPFPTGLKIASREGTGLISWAWAVNGGASVFGSVLAILLSMTYGFTITLIVSAALYVGALASFVALNYKSHGKATATVAV